MNRDPGCVRCPLSATATTVCLPGDGNPAADFVFVGEAPGASEDARGKPFIGDAGRVLDELLTVNGLSRADVYVTNAVKCRPPSNRTPRPAEIAACRSYLMEELAEVNPKVVVTLGNTPLTALTGKKGISNERGKVNMVAGLPPIVPTFHPAAALYRDSRATKSQIGGDIRVAKAVAHGPVGDHSAEIIMPAEYLSGPSGKARDLFDAPLVTVDLEWTAGAKNKIVWPWSGLGEAYTISLTGKVAGRYLTRTFGLPLLPEDHADIQHILSTARIVFHNGPADMQWVLALGFRKANWAADTMILAHLLDETQPLNLEAVSSRYGGVPAGWKGVLYSQRPRLREDWERLLQYNSMDTYATLKAFEGEATAVSQLGQRRSRVQALHAKLLIPGSKVLTGSTRSGVPLNREKMVKLRQELIQRRDAVAVELAEIAHVTPPMAAKIAASPEKTVQFLRGSLGIAISDSKEQTLADLDYPIVDKIRAWRKENKLITTYLTPWLALTDRQGDNLLHSMYKPTGTRTGRFSADGERGGTLHTMPKKREFRELVEADDGELIVAGDYSQVELRVLAHVTKDPTMVAAYRLNEDLHRTTAAYLIASKSMGGPPPMQTFWAERHKWTALVTKTQRDDAKAVNFGLAYGMMPPKFRIHARQEYGVYYTEEEAREVHRAYFALYARLGPWHGEIMAYARSRGYVDTDFGRRLTIDPANLHVSLNTPIQSMGSDLTVLAMNYTAERYRREGIRAIVIGFVHDSILVRAKENHAERAAEIMKETMENLDLSPFSFAFSVPLVAEVEIGKTW